MLKDNFFLASGNLRHRGLRSWLTMLGIFIGIAAVVSLISLGDGLREGVTGQFSTLDADKLIVQNTGAGFGPPGSTVVNKLNSHDINLIERVENVEEVVPRLVRVVSVEFNKIKKFRFIASLPKDKTQLDIIYDALNVGVEEGRILEAGEKGKVLLGSDFRDDSFEKEIRVGSNILIQGKNFEVSGFLKPASSFQINSVILMDEDELREVLDLEEEIDLIVVQLKDNVVAEDIAEDIKRKLRKDRDLDLGEEDFSVQTPSQGIETINDVLTTINLIIVGIAAISLLVGGVGIANTMYSSVLERTKEIGIMKSIGAKNSDILSIFMIESAILGLMGGIVGAIIGLGLAFSVSALAASALPGLNLAINASIPLIIFSISFSLLIGVISGIFPALQASKLNPVEALRKW